MTTRLQRHRRMALWRDWREMLVAYAQCDCIGDGYRAVELERAWVDKTAIGGRRGAVRQLVAIVKYRMALRARRRATEIPMVEYGGQGGSK